MDSHTPIYLFHVLFAAPLFLYVAFKRTDIPDWLYGILGFMAAGIFLYHAWRAYGRLSTGKSAWVNWIHIALVVPVLAVTAIQKEKTPRRVFEMLALLGFAALGYHGTYLIRGLGGAQGA